MGLRVKIHSANALSVDCQTNVIYFWQVKYLSKIQLFDGKWPEGLVALIELAFAKHFRQKLSLCMKSEIACGLVFVNALKHHADKTLTNFNLISIFKSEWHFWDFKIFLFLVYPVSLPLIGSELSRIGWARDLTVRDGFKLRPYQHSSKCGL